LEVADIKKSIPSKARNTYLMICDVFKLEKLRRAFGFYRDIDGGDGNLPVEIGAFVTVFHLEGFLKYDFAIVAGGAVAVLRAAGEGKNAGGDHQRE
jgi:hypothetical protein